MPGLGKVLSYPLPPTPGAQMPCSRMSASLAPRCFPAWAGPFRNMCVFEAQSGTPCAANKGPKESL